MLIGELRPTSKNSVSQQFVSDNYRPVLNSLILLKLFEYTLEPTLSKHLNLNNRQFGYRQGTACMIATAVVKEAILQYTTENTNVHAAILDMSKAFDRINHKKVFMKLIDTSLPPPIVKIINYMNCNSSVYVNVSGNSWKVENGTRQGGCLSGLLFSFYVNDIIEEASNSAIGCFIDFNCVNIICYADDVILLCPSANGLQFLIEKLVLNLSLNSLKLNANKSKYMIFNCKIFRNYDFK